MKATFRTSTLAAALKSVSHFVCDNDIKPIISCAKLTVAKDGSWSVEGTDLEMCAAVRGSDATNVEAEGSCLLPADKAATAFAMLANDDVYIEAVEKVVRVVCGSDAYHFPLADPAKFPEMKKFDAKAWHEVDAGKFVELISKTAFAVSSGDMMTPEKRVQYKTSGAFLKFDGGICRMVALDGKIMATGTIPSEEMGKDAHEDQIQHVLPYDFTVAASKVLGVEGKAKVALDANTARVECGGVLLSTLLLNGRYPPWQVLLGDTSKKTQVKMPWGLLRDAVKRALVVTDGIESLVTFDFGKNNLIVSAQSQSYGTSRTEIAVGCEKPTKLTFSASILKPIIKAVAADAEVVVEIEDKDEHGRDKVVLIREGDYTYAAMPMLR